MHCIRTLGGLLDRLRAVREASAARDDLDWHVSVLVHALRTTNSALEGLCDVLARREGDVHRLPPGAERQRLVDLSAEFVQTTVCLVNDLLALGVEAAVTSPTVLPLELQGLALREPREPRAEQLCRDGRSRSPRGSFVVSSGVSAAGLAGTWSSTDVVLGGPGQNPRLPSGDVDTTWTSTMTTSTTFQFH